MRQAAPHTTAMDPLGINSLDKNKHTLHKAEESGIHFLWLATTSNGHLSGQRRKEQTVEYFASMPSACSTWSPKQDAALEDAMANLHLTAQTVSQV